MTKRTGKFYECGICDHIHPWDWDGDCREDASRLTWDDIDECQADVLSWADRCCADWIEAEGLA